MTSEYILETQALTKDFRGFTAVAGVDLKVRRGSIHALIGPNGAGKSTCFNLLTKFLQPTSGRILYEGEDITRERPATIARRGVIRSFQISAVFPQMTALENVRLGLLPRLGVSFQFWRPGRYVDQLDARAMELLTDVGLQEFAHHVVAELPYGRKRALEIATTLAMDPRLLLLDEPTQGMGHEDVERIAQLIRRVAVGRTVLIVEHNMAVVAGLCDRISVLSRGRLIAEGDYETVSANPEVVEAYMGAADEVLEGAHG